MRDKLLVVSGVLRPRLWEMETHTYSCTGNSGDTVCVWYNTAHTAYTVQNGAYNDCTGFSPSGGTLVMYSPNSNNFANTSGVIFNVEPVVMKKTQVCPKKSVQWIAMRIWELICGGAG